MAAQVIINKKRKAAAAAAAAAGKEMPGVQFHNPTFRPSRTEALHKKGRRPRGGATTGSDTSDGEGFSYGKMGIEDGLAAVEEHDQTIISRIYDVVKATKTRKGNYMDLFLFLIFTVLYFTALYLQANAAGLYKLTTTMESLLPQNILQDQVADYDTADDVYNYLNETFIQTVWADPICGDGVCDRPVEFEGFGRFGCSIDCGDMDTVDVRFQFTTTFGSPADQAAADWNVCQTYPDHLCWFEANQPFTDRIGVLDTTLALPNGTWELRVTAPNNGVVGTASRSLSGTATDRYAEQTLTSFGSCVPDEVSDLAKCRAICAANAACTSACCSNIFDTALGNVFIDCVSLCNANMTIMSPYANKTCVQVAQLANTSEPYSFLATRGLKCQLDPAYLALHPEEASLLNAPPAPRQTVALNTSELVVGGSARRRLSQLSPNPSLGGGNITELYWNLFGENDRQRFTNLATAVSRAIDTWTVDSCLAKYTISSSRNGPPMLGFFCAYFGGPPTLPGCSFRPNGTNITYTSANAEGLQNVLLARYGRGGRYNISEVEQTQFVTILLNALDATIGTGLSPEALTAVEDRLHEADNQVVQQEGNNCNFVNVALEWRLNVHYTTNLSLGDSIQFVWADDLPHALRGEGLDDLQDVFRGVGANRRLLSRGTICSPLNIGEGENGTFRGDPTPCVLGRTREGNIPGGFSATTVFKNPGVYAYRDQQYGNLMTGTVYVSSELGNTPSILALPQEEIQCSPGCPIRFLSNGRCDSSFNCLTSECSFDGGDCACPDPASLVTSSSTTSIAADSLCQCPTGQIKGPNAACCEAEFIGVNQKLPFDVIVQSSEESVLNPSTFIKTRYATNHNRVIGGLLLHQVRSEGSTCKSKRFLELFQWCGGAPSTTPFGVDPVFIPASSLYSIDVAPRVNQFYLPQELNAQSIPRGFVAEETKGFPSGFPLVFDVNLDQAGASDRLQYMVDGLFLDNATETLTVTMLTFNGFENLFAFMEVRFSFLEAGKIAIKHSIVAILMQPYLATKDYIQATLEIIVAFMILYAFYSELKEAIQTRRRTGSFLRHFHSFWNYVDAISIVLLLTAVVMRLIFVFSLSPSFRARPRYDIYEDLQAEARFFGMRREGLEFDDFAKMLQNIRYITTFRAIYTAINGINIFFMILRILKLMDFQPRMGVLTRTLAAAAPDILNFFVLWALIFLGYAFMGHLIVGSSVEYFRSLGFSMVTCFLIILGDTSAENDLLALDGWQFVASQLFFWSFNIFMVMVVMNFLVAIAVDAFADIKEKTEAAPTIVEELFEYGKYGIERPFKKRLTDGKMLKQLKAWGARKEKLRHEKEAGDAGKAKEAGDDDSDEDTSVGVEEQLVLLLDGQQLDFETLHHIFERRRQAQVATGPKTDSRLIARQILAEYGDRAAAKEQKKKKPKKNQDILELKANVSGLKRQLADIGDTIEAIRATAFEALIESGLLKGVAPGPFPAEAQQEEAAMEGVGELGGASDFGSDGEL